MNDDDAFRRFLDRATEDPPDSFSLGEERPRPLAQPSARRRGRILAVAAAIVIAVGIASLYRGDGETPTEVVPVATSASSTSTSSTPTTRASSTSTSTTSTISTASTTPTTSEAVTEAESPTRLDVALPASLAEADNGASLTPSVGPELTVEKVGEGSITSASNRGAIFGPGGQQRTDYAILTRVGADVGDLIPPTGSATISFTPQVDMADRQVTPGRNNHAWFDIVSRESPDDQILGIQLNVDPDIGPYLSGTIGGEPFNHTLTEAEVAEFASGQPVVLTLSWDEANGQVSLNSQPMVEFALGSAPVQWENSARLTIGAAANYGGGFFAAANDAIESLVIVEN